MNFGKLTYFDQKDFLEKNGHSYQIVPLDFTGYQEIFDSPDAVYTIPVLDLYRSSLIKEQRSSIPDYTPVGIRQMTKADQDLFVEFLDLSPDTSDLPESIYRILAWIGKLHPSGHPEDYHVRGLISNSSTWNNFNLLLLAAKRHNRKPNPEQRNYVKKLVTNMVDQEDYPEGIFLLNDDSLFEEMILLTQTEDYDLKPSDDGFLEIVLESRNLKRVEYAAKNFGLIGDEYDTGVLVATHDIPFIDEVYKLVDLYFSPEHYLEALPNRDMVDYLKSKDVEMPGIEEFISAVLALDSKQQEDSGKQQEDSGKQQKIWLPVVLSVDFWSDAFKERDKKYERMSTTEFQAHFFSRVYDLESDDEEVKEEEKKIEEPYTREDIQLEIDRAELMARFKSKQAMDYLERIDQLVAKFPETISDLLALALERVELFNHMVELAEYSEEDLMGLLTGIILPEKTPEQQPYHQKVRVAPEIFQQYVAKYRHNFNWFKRMVDSKYIDQVMSYELTFEERNYLVLALITAASEGKFRALLDQHPQKPLDLNAALVHAINLGRFNMVDDLLRMGATNIREAIEQANPEKKTWAQRRFAHLLN